MATTQNLEGLYRFFLNDSNKCHWDFDNLEVKESPLGGTGVFATKDLSTENEEDVLLLRIAKEDILSHRNCAITNLLYDHDIFGIQAMILAFIYEKSLGKSSPWYEYIGSINMYDDAGELILPPSMWPDEEQELLKGTEAEVLGVTDPSEAQEFFIKCIEFAKSISAVFPIPYELSANSNDTQEENTKRFEMFVACCAAIASRAFAIDNFHEIALVPGADLFNHDCYNQENVHFETISDVCPVCGSSDECGHNSEDEDESGEESWEEMSVDEEKSGQETDQEEDDEEPITEITAEYISKMEEDLEAERQEEEDADEEETGEEDEDFSSDDEEGDEDMFEEFAIPDESVDIVLVKDVKKGEEIFNTYGKLSNSVLIARYGFTAPFNVNDYVGLGREALKTAKTPKHKKRIEFWEERGFSMFQEYLQLKNKALHKSGHCENGGDCCEEDGDCCGKEDGGCEDGDDCCQEEDEDEEEQTEESWELELRFDFHGEPSESTYALANLLSLPQKEFKSLAQETEPEKLLEALDELCTPNPDAYSLLQQWHTQRSSLYKDGGLSSSQYEEVIQKTQNPHTRAICILIQSEKSILEKSAKFLKSRV